MNDGCGLKKSFLERFSSYVCFLGYYYAHFLYSNCISPFSSNACILLTQFSHLYLMTILFDFFFSIGKVALLIKEIDLFWNISLSCAASHANYVSQGADNSTLYGCCILMEELVDKPSRLISLISDSQPVSSCLGRYIFTTKRCYCILSRLPFFGLHFGVLKR